MSPEYVFYRDYGEIAVTGKIEDIFRVGPHRRPVHGAGDVQGGEYGHTLTCPAGGPDMR